MLSFYDNYLLNVFILTKDNISTVLLSREMILAQVNLCLPYIPDIKRTVNQVQPSHVTVMSSIDIIFFGRFFFFFSAKNFAVHNV